MNRKPIKLISNYVLVKPDEDFTTFQLAGRETDIHVGYDQASHAQHYSCRGTVIAVPEKLIYNGDKLEALRKEQSSDIQSGIIPRAQDLKSMSMHYDVPIEIVEGDRVFFRYMEHFDAYREGRIIEDPAHGELLLIRYDMLICAELNLQEGFLMLNGYVLVEPVKPSRERDGAMEYVEGNFGLVLPSIAASGAQSEYIGNRKQRLGKVINAGAICKGYLEFPGVCDDASVQVQDRYVLYSPAFANSFEFDLHRVVYADREVARLHRKDLICVFEAQLTENEIIKLLQPNTQNNKIHIHDLQN